ncbi:hypothetical protein B0T16DRAFT_397234, partial [Cercophora newfieldiana]
GTAMSTHEFQSHVGRTTAGGLSGAFLTRGRHLAGNQNDHHNQHDWCRPSSRYPLTKAPPLRTPPCPGLVARGARPRDLIRVSSGGLVEAGGRSWDVPYHPSQRRAERWRERTDEVSLVV